MLKNFVEESCIGTGDLITLTGATIGNITFLKSLKTGQYINYVIEDLSTSVKVSGIGIFNAANNTILRADRWQFDGTNVIDNPISNIVLSSGNHRIRCDITAESTEILSRIDDSITANARVIYNYNTSKDTIDWRHNENTSWYNEPLNTATRGGTREFPAVALIVAETNKITFYDATNPLLPMWRVFNTVAFQGFGSFNSIACKNGVIYLTANQNDGINGNLHVIDFINDEVKVINSAGTYIKNTGSSIADSNIAGTANIYVSTTTKLVHNTALMVVIATLKDGSDAVYVTTQAGATRIISDGTVSYWNDLGNATSYVASVAINDGRVFFNVWSNQDAVRVISQPVNAPLVNTASNVGMAYSGLNSDVRTNALTPLHVAGQNALSFRVAEKALFSAKGLYLINPNSSSYGLGLHATITSSFNSGYQYGDIKGAWLADTVAESITATELVINGTFSTNTLNWVVTDAGTIAWNAASYADITTVNYYCGYQLLTVIPNKTYNFSMDVLAGNARVRIYDGSSVSANTLVSKTGTTTISATFKASGSTVYLRLGTSLQVSSASVDNISVSLAVADRSYNNNGLAIYGTLTKTPVNTGCELVWFNYSLAQTATTTATGYIEWWEEVAGVPTKYVKNLAGTGDYVNGRTGTVSSSVSIAGGTLTINAGVNITLLRVGNGFPTVEQIAHAYNQEKHLFNQNTACTLAGTSDNCKAVDYDSDTGLHHVATTTNKSVFKGLVRVSSKVGAFTTVSAQNDYVAEG